MSENLKTWDAIRRPPQEHLKGFKRGGGFSGTAIKPMWAIQMMTEIFGACGEGWGYDKPEFQTMPGAAETVLVYCTVGLWTGKPDAPRVYGVGGDFVVARFQSGLKPDDEAFKKAFTDALMNAMKHLGMAADIHMNLFDGNKYVDEQPEAKRPTNAEDVKNATIRWVDDRIAEFKMMNFQEDLDWLLEKYAEAMSRLHKKDPDEYERLIKAETSERDRIHQRNAA